MLTGTPLRACEAAPVTAPEGDQPLRPERRDQPVAGRAAAMQVDGDVGGGAGPAHRLELGGGQQFVDGAGQRDQVSQPARRGQHDQVPGEGAPDGPVGGHPGQEITQAQGAEQEYPAGHGQRAPRAAAPAACSRVVDRPAR